MMDSLDLDQKKVVKALAIHKQAAYFRIRNHGKGCGHDRALAQAKAEKEPPVQDFVSPAPMGDDWVGAVT